MMATTLMSVWVSTAFLMLSATARSCFAVVLMAKMRFPAVAGLAGSAGAGAGPWGGWAASSVMEPPSVGENTHEREDQETDEPDEDDPRGGDDGYLLEFLPGGGPRELDDAPVFVEELFL